MMTEPTLVKVTLFNPGPLGDDDTPFVGRAGFTPSLIRHIEGEDPPDYVVTTTRFFVTFGAPLMDGDTVLEPGEPGVAWVYLEPTNVGVYADLWFWKIEFFAPNAPDNACADAGDFFVPEVPEGTVVDFGDLTPVDPDNPPVIPPEWQTQINTLIGQVASLQAQIDEIVTGQCVAVSNDGSFGLTTPTGVGFEAIINADVLQDFRFDGVSL